LKQRPAELTSTPATRRKRIRPVAWKVPKGNWTLNDDGTFTTAAGGKGTWQWGDRSKRELELKWQKLGDGKAIFSADGKTVQVTLPKGGQTTLTR